MRGITMLDNNNNPYFVTLQNKQSVQPLLAFPESQPQTKKPEPNSSSVLKRIGNRLKTIEQSTNSTNQPQS